ncbi:MAG TPA: beta-ketoacyl synthase chain length factor [Bacteroidales bacterium]|nr:beta-ketoacyl synthase chain length factor [Bacteroidales bacterium]
MKAYIHSTAVISPQKTFSEEGFPGEILSFPEARFLKCIEPVYRDYIDPMVARRMSRIVKMGVCAALKCLKSADVSTPDAIIAGTGLGCLEDTEKFLSSIYTNDEKLLNPTPFIQSTHNTVAGAIALAIKCHSYNSTYTNRGFSFESAMTDALLQLSENPGRNILAGGFDELTETSYAITSRMGFWRKAIPGEGVAFFMLTGEKHMSTGVLLRHMNTFFLPEAADSISERVKEFLNEAALTRCDIDVVISGNNGDQKTDLLYSRVLNDIFPAKPVIPFKKFCGEYDTASSFALYLATVLLKDNLSGLFHIPPQINRILVYNHLRGIDHSLFLLERC